MPDELNIDDLFFLDDDPYIYKEGIQEYQEKHDRGEAIEPVMIFHKENGKFYARGDRHRTYFFYNVLNKKTIPYEMAKGFKLSKGDKQQLKTGGITVHDLIVISLDDTLDD